MAANTGDFQTFSDLGVLVVGHGTRDPVGQAQMRSLACQTAGQLAPLVTELGFLELATPTIETAVARLAAAGVRRLITAPVLLFRAGHADQDIPEAVAAAAAQHAVEVIGQTPPLEHQTNVLDLSAERFREAMRAAGRAGSPAADIHLAMIARGSSSSTAAEAMLRFAELRAGLTPVGACRVGYVAVRQPDVAQTLDWLAASAAQVLVVQPHLLFEGEVYHSLCAAVDERRRQDEASPPEGGGQRRSWVVCSPLGPAADDYRDQRLAEVLAQLVRDELNRHPSALPSRR